MIIGVPKEIKTNENRIALVPAGAETLVSHKHTVLIEQRVLVANQQVLLPYTEPAGDPNVDGIRFGQWTRCSVRPLAKSGRLAVVVHACLTLCWNCLFDREESAPEM